MDPHVVSEASPLRESGVASKMGTWKLLEPIMDISVSGQGGLRVKPLIAVLKSTVEPLPRSHRAQLLQGKNFCVVRSY